MQLCIINVKIIKFAYKLFSGYFNEEKASDCPIKKYIDKSANNVVTEVNREENMDRIKKNVIETLEYPWFYAKKIVFNNEIIEFTSEDVAFCLSFSCQK